MGTAEGLLEFAEVPSLGGGSHPEEEANILCNVLALVLEARVSRSGLRINGVDLPAGEQDTLHEHFRGTLEPILIDECLGRLLTLPIDLARQFVRACRSYASALEFIPSDPTFAFFLLVVALECLSSQDAVIPSAELEIDSKKCERFCEFVRRNLPEAAKGVDERDAVLLTELLKNTYYSHRSAFVHGGKEVSAASLMADKAGSSYFKHSTDGRETKTPGLVWFARLVRSTLIGYLQSLSLTANRRDDNLLASLAFERALLNIRVTRDIEAHRFVTLKDLDFR